MEKKRSIILGILIAVSLLLTIGCDLIGTGGGGSSVVTYAIGDTGPSGVGIVFYITDGGLHGLEMAPDDQSTEAAWSNIADELIGTTGTEIGTGFVNTVAIMNQSGNTISAAEICRNYRYLEEGNWFLPSKDELNAIWDNIVDDGDGHNSGVGGFANAYYWSSSEISSFDMAWYQVFGDGHQSFSGKDDYHQVRAVRAF